MGSENSKPKPMERSYSQEKAVQRALKQQREMYEARYSEIILSQIEIQESINRNRIDSSHSASDCETSTSNALYPNIQEMGHNNNLRVAGNSNDRNNHASMSRKEVQPTSSFASSAAPLTNTPSAPIVPTASSNPFLIAAPNNINSSNGYTIPKNGPSTSLASSLMNAPSTHTVPTTSSNPNPITIPNNNINSRNTSNRGAIPKNRRTLHEKNKNKSLGVECVTCKNNFGFQIYQCENGHSSCHGCRYASKMCGQCSKPITSMRNITLEATLANINILPRTNTVEKIKCYNATDGCCLSFNPGDMDNHLKECPYKDIECPLNVMFQNCTWSGKIQQLSSHFKDRHPEQCIADVDTEMILCNIKADQRIVYLVNIGNFNFLVHIKVVENEKIIYMTVQMLGTKVSAIKWTYEFHIYNNRAPLRKYQYIDVCLSNADSLDEIFKNVQCAAIPLDYAQTFYSDFCLSYKFFIKKRNFRRNATLSNDN